MDGNVLRVVSRLTEDATPIDLPVQKKAVTAALEAVTAPSTVIATGGGIILTEFNRHFMQNNGIVVYLCEIV